MKVLILSRYDRQGASSRLRTLQYIPYLKASGLEVETASLFDAAYLGDLYGGRRSMGRIAAQYLARLRKLRTTARPDVIWLEKEALPWLPWALERVSLPKGVPIVADYDDAIFHRYDTHRFGIVRALLGRKIDKVMAASVLVTAGNPYLAERAQCAGAQNVRIVPTVLDTSSYQPAVAGPPREHTAIGWIGTPETWAVFAHAYTPFLTGLCRETDSIVLAVGADEKLCEEPEIMFLPWSEDTEVELIQRMDIGIMPLSDTPWARGKCGYKLIQYMACGLPVVASPVGVNRDIVEHGVNGFLASTNAEWRQALETLIADPDLRQRMGRAGRARVESQYSLQFHGPRVANLLRDAALTPGSVATQ